MFSVIPAPYPSYPSTGADARAVLDLSNRLEPLQEDEYQFVAGEGTYVLRDSLLLGNPGAVVAENIGTQQANPLDTRPTLPNTGTTLSLIAGIKPAASQSTRIARLDASSVVEDGSSQANSTADLHDGGNSNGIGSFRAADLDSDYAGSDSRGVVFGHNNPLLSVHSTKDGEKRSRKPKNNIVKTSSSFVQKVMPADNLSKRLRDRNSEGILAFANVNRSLQWLDLDPPDALHKADPLTKILFTRTHVLCHDINHLTHNNTHADLIIGFSSGDIIWLEPFSQKYTRINKNGLINPHPVIQIKWLLDSSNLFMAAHSDGTLVVYDKEKDDAAFTAESHDLNAVSHDKPRLLVMKSVSSQNQKCNPVAFWRLSTQRINAISFSPDGQYLAAGTEAGRLYVVDHHTESVLDVFVTFFGGIQAVCWSPDGQYVLFGGQDDMISIVSSNDREIVARFQGHDSWINHLAFDPWRCDGRNFRFGSVGDDCRLLLWDFNASMLQRPRAASIRQRNSVASNAFERKSSYTEDAKRDEVDGEAEQSETDSGLHLKHGILHPPRGWKDVPRIPAVMEIIADSHELTWLDFQHHSIIASCGKGHIRMWERPQEASITRASHDT